MARSAGRERTVCESCELPYYAEGGTCPYCGDGTDDDPGRSDDSGFVFGTDEATGDAKSASAEPAAGERGRDGLVERIKRALGL